ncbi:putative acetyltransferase [Rubripirellula lacrimiformis]|uniref:Putative acetyltransferase n=1 Tax=Rubripirellula lacrimiformis TaxID=1930273 RepID=A0A517NHA3_9BACT|nr:GNAT family N-acetyltransferase [Rubripirellula lacrimiformis]QDT06516.1 putative acetyltransferase [Rubripirellula lacrimiformis]
MGMTYFKRFRMEYHFPDGFGDNREEVGDDAGRGHGSSGLWPIGVSSASGGSVMGPLEHARSTTVPAGYSMVPFSSGLVREHATAKYQSFRQELDVNVFPCLGRRDGCMRLMREIASREGFVAGATWLCRFRDPPTGHLLPVGTVQGLEIDGWGAIQNLGIDTLHRGRGLGTILLARAAQGFREAGLTRMHLEVTTENTAAIRLYERMGFKRAQVVYKAADVAGV